VKSTMATIRLASAGMSNVAWPRATVGEAVWAKQGGVMAKRHCRPSTQYRYEHYDPGRTFDR